MAQSLFSRKTSYLIAIVVLLQVVCILVLILNILSAGQFLAGSASVHSIPKEDLTFYPGGSLKYFYEPSRNTNISRTEKFVGYTPIYTINSDYLNERFDYPVKKSTKTFRIIVLGDSFTYGLYVNTRDNYVEKLEDLLNSGSCDTKLKYEVLNLGMEGYDLEYSIERFKNRGQKYNPDLVIWLVHSDDLYQVAELTIPLIDDLNQEMKKNGTYKTFDDNGNFLSPYTKARDEFVKKYSKESIENYQRTVLDGFNGLYHGPLYIFTFSYQETDLVNFFRQYTTQRQNTYFEPNLPDFRKENGSFRDGHPNVYGHTIIANNIYKYLNKSGLVYCPK